MGSLAFRQCFADLTTGIQYGVGRISSVAYSRDLICDSVLQQVMESHQSQNKTMFLLKAIEFKISDDSRNFQRFVDILKEEACYDNIVKKLEVKWSK